MAEVGAARQFQATSTRAGMSDLDGLTRRVDQLETLMRHLYSEVQGLRAGAPAEPTAAGRDAAVTMPKVPEPQATASVGAPSASPSPPASAPRSAPPVAASRAGMGSRTEAPPRSGPSIESLVGRYGTLALATVTILLGVGAFVSWAIEHRLLSPEVRVVLGLVAAAGVAIAGMWFRAHQSARFGNALLALALAIVHVDAWGAGPELHLVSSSAALFGAALASAALAWLARREAEQPLFAVGVGGALIAPFVTSNGESHVLALLLFGFIVISLTMVAIRDRGWDLPVFLLAAAVFGYTAVGVATASRYSETLYTPAAFALACAVVSLTLMPARYRSWLAQTALASLGGALTAITGAGGSVARIIGGAAAGTMAAYATLPGLGESPIRTWLGAGFLPGAFLAVVLWAIPHRYTSTGAAYALAWGAGAVGAATVFAKWQGGSAKEERWSLDVGAAIAAGTAGCTGSLAIFLAWSTDHSLRCIIFLAAYAALLALLAGRIDWWSLLVPSFITLSVAAMWAEALLVARPRYGYMPFLTEPSGAAAAVIAGWVLAVVGAGQFASGRKLSETTPKEVSAAALIPAVLLFWWVRTELAGAVSADVSTFLLIVYYAVAGVAAVFVGRVRGMALLRNAGLGIAGYAALKAISESWNLSIGLRVGSDLLAGVFMLAVAYWYRGERRGDETEAAGG